MRIARHNWPILGAVLLSGFALRLGMLLYASPKPAKLFAPDSFGYDKLATNLLTFGVFSQQSQPPFTLEMERTPGYPAVMALVYAFAGHMPEAVAFAQMILAVATAWLAYLLARRLSLSERAGLLVALLVSVEPVSAMTSNLLLTEILFTFLLTAVILSLASWWQDGRSAWLISAAILLGLSALVRPVSQFLPIALAPLVAVVAARAGWRSATLSLLVFLALGLGITYSWAYRNYAVAGEFTLSTVSDINLVYYRAREVLASAEGITQGEALLRLQQRIPAAASPAERAAAERKEALSVLTGHPRETLQMIAGGVARTFADPGFTTTCTLLDTESTAMECFPGEASMNESGSLTKALKRFGEMTPLQKGVILWSLILSAILYATSILSVVSLVRCRSWIVLTMLLLPLLYLVLVSAGSEAYSRFRIPFVPELAILAAIGVEAILVKRRLGISLAKPFPQQ